MNLEKFKELGLSESTIKELQKKGFEEPTEIQAKVIPILLESNIDIIGQAQTGTGKTAAFGLPLIEKLESGSKSIQALILVPTRELAIQVAAEISSFKGKKKLQVIPIYGGQSMPDQLRRLNSGVDIVVGTPGRTFDHIKRKSLKLGNVSYVILDEADEMLNMGFIDDVEEILKHTNEEKRVLFFSATMPAKIMNIAKKYMGKYKVITTKKEHLTADLTDQIYFETAPQDKFESLCRIIDIETEFYGLIFCRTKVSVDEVTRKLIERGYAADGIHGDLSQQSRERILAKFKKQRIRILVATDIAARGIDVENLSHVINYALPQDPESYIHRIGRTGRAGKKGIAITFISHEEYRKLMQIKRITKTTIRKEKLPGASEIVKLKKSRIKSELNEIISNEQHTQYVKIAMQMLSENEPIDIVAAMLKYSFEDELDEKKYKNISEISVNTKGTTRLFVSFGRKEGLTPPKLVKLITNDTKVSSGKIQDVKVLENFSFLTVPFEDAKIILKNFSHGKNTKKPHIQVANKLETKSQKRKRKNDKKY